MSDVTNIQIDEPATLPWQWSSLAVVGIFVALLVALFGVAFLYHFKLILTSQEQTWIDSQQTTQLPVTPLLDDTTEIELQRTQCFGECPAYRVTLFGSGRVEFHGAAYVCDKSPNPTVIDPLLVQQLVNGLVTIDFLRMPNYTSYDATDNPSAIITLKTGYQLHQVEHYFGDIHAPRLLHLIEDRIDEVAQTSKWIGNCRQR